MGLGLVGVRPCWRQAFPPGWGQALSLGNVPFIPFDLKAFSWIRPDPKYYLLPL